MRLGRLCHVFLIFISRFGAGICSCRNRKFFEGFDERRLLDEMDAGDRGLCINGKDEVMKEPVRVLHIFAALDSGGVSNFVVNLYREIDKEKVQFDFAITSGQKALYDDEVRMCGARVFYFDISRSLLSNLHRIIREKGPFCAVHSHLFFYSGLLMAEAKAAGIPIRISHAHNANTGESRSFPRVAYERGMQGLIRLNATHLLGCSEKACRYVFGSTVMQDPRAMVIPDGIDCRRFSFDPRARQEVREQYGLSDKFVVGHVGHFNPAKNHEKILSVFRKICERRPDAVLLLVGDGELEGEVRKEAADPLLAGRVIFAGAHKDVERFYQAMDVFLFPSRYEGFGMAMIEAQAGGLACVASDVVPSETDVDGRTVFLPLEAEDDLWAAKLLEAPERSTLACEKVREKYSSFHTAEILMSIYEGIK